MGYILPINHEQYNEYTKRVARKDKPALTLEGVEKPTIDTKLKGKQQQYNQDQHFYQYKPTPIHDVDDETIDYYLADLEGKGQKFNETV